MRTGEKRRPRQGADVRYFGGEQSTRSRDAEINPPRAEVQDDLFGSTSPAAIVNIGRRCPCGGETFITGPGKGPHAASLECVSCGRFGGWLPRDVAASLRRAV
jgi:hypothetical protein